MRYRSNIEKNLLLRIGRSDKNSAFYLLHAFLPRNKKSKDYLFLDLWEKYLLAYRIFDDIVDGDGLSHMPHFFHFYNDATEILRVAIPLKKNRKLFLENLSEMHVHMVIDLNTKSDFNSYLSVKITPTTYKKSYGITAVIHAYLAQKIKNYIDSKHRKRVDEFIRCFLVARQLSDDASDWQNDILKYTKTKKIPLVHRKLFENKLGFIYAQSIVENLDKARGIAELLNDEMIIKDLTLVTNIIDKIYIPASKIINLRKKKWE